MEDAFSLIIAGKTPPIISAVESPLDATARYPGFLFSYLGILWYR